jgi:hypothetical protein
MQGIWIQADEKGNITYVTNVILHKTKTGKNGRFHGITFNGYHRPWGRWIYQYTPPTGLLLLEFAAGSGYPRRHVLVQNDDNLFELAKDHPHYAEDSLWSKDSVKHTNTKRTFFQKWNPPCASDEVLGESSA